MIQGVKTHELSKKSLTYTNTYVIDEVQKKKKRLYISVKHRTYSTFNVPHLLAKKVRYIISLRAHWDRTHWELGN